MNLLINGLITGAVFAVAATGLVVTYSTSGVFNFAHGALGMFCAYLYWDLRVNDHHQWPLLPAGSWPAPLALAAVLLVIAPALGAALYLIVIRGLQGTSETVRLVVPISVLLAVISLANWIWKPNIPHTIQPFFGADHKVIWFGVVLLWHDLTVLAVAVALAIGLRVLLYRTRLGISMRAVVDDRSLLELNGARPDRVSLASWMLGVSLSALAGILITPSQGGTLSSTLLTLLVINAFAAAMFGRLRNLPLTFAGAVVLGLATRMAFERPTGLMPSSFDWRGNLRLAVPMILLFVVLVALPQDRLRGAVAVRTRERFAIPALPMSLASAAGLFVAVVALSRLMEPTALLTLSEAFAVGIIALSLVLLVGYAGEVSLATMALAGIGGTVFFHHVGHNAADRAGPLPYVTAMAVAALIGAVVALPALRLRGIYLGLATAAFSLGVEQLLFKEFAAPRRIYPATLVVLIGASLAGAVMVYRRQGRRRAALVTVGSVVLIVVAASNHWLQHERWSALFPNGNLQVPRPRLFGVDFKAQDAFLLLLTAVFCVVAVGLVWLRNSAYGRRLTALKNSPAAAATLGMNVVRLKLSVFMLSAAIAALGGCLYAQQLGAVTSGPFSLFESMSLLMLLVVAGAGFVSGGLAAGLLYGAVFVTMQRIFDKLGQDYSAFSGWFAWLAQFTTVLPALIGVGLGRNPAGFLSDAFSSWRPLIARRRPWMIGVLAVEVGLWVLADSELIGNWTFALATAAILILVPRLGAQVWPDGRDGQGRVLEFIGVDSEFTPADLVVINRGLGLFGAES